MFATIQYGRGSRSSNVNDPSAPAVVDFSDRPAGEEDGGSSTSFTLAPAAGSPLTALMTTPESEARCARAGVASASRRAMLKSGLLRAGVIAAFTTSPIATAVVSRKIL